MMQKNNQKIPEGWSVKKLSDLCSKISDGIHTTPKYVDKSEYHFINGNNLRDGHICIYEDTKCVSFEEYIKQKQKLGTHTLLMSINGTIGSLANYYNEDVVLGKSAAFMNFNDMQTKKYVYTILQTNSTKRYFENELTGSTIKNLSLKSIKSMKILLPPLPEQEKIAGILGTWDEAIEKLSNLIEQKKLLKKGLMQKLLTGKTRLPGFTQPWKEVKLCDILHEHLQTSSGNEVVCSVSVHKGVVDQIEHLGRSFSAANTSNYNLVHYGDVIYTKSPTGDFPYGIFKQSQQKNDVIVSPLYGVFTPSSYALGYILDAYFSYPINMNNYLRPIIQKGAKNTINITNKTFLSRSLFLPTDISEQQAIADVLSTADDEINLLNQKLEALKEQKKGLMQQLLTGQIRVKVN